MIKRMRSAECRVRSRVGRLITGLLGMLLVFSVSAQAQDKPARRLDKLVQNSASSAAAVKVREGRDLISEEKWDRAQQKFLEVINRHAGSEYNDAALYWLAFAYKKQNKYRSADETLVKLVSSHPRSSWINDAKSMRMELAPQLGRSEDVADEARNAQNDEIKIVALQSLFRSSPDRAMQFTADILAPESTAGYRVKEGAITLLGRFNDHDLGPQATKILLTMTREEPNEKLRLKAVYHLGRGEWSEAKFSFDGDEAIVPTLTELALQTENRELAEAAVEAVAHIANHVDDPGLKPSLLRIAKEASSRNVRQKAINRLGQMAENEGDALLTDMISILDGNTDDETRKHVLSVISKMDTPEAHNYIVEFASSANPQDIRKRAIYIIGARGNADAVQKLSAIYENETDRDMKRMIISAFSQSKHIIGLEKLMHIAQNDDDMKLRMEAVTLLGRSKAPEARQFLEQLLK